MINWTAGAAIGGYISMKILPLFLKNNYNINKYRRYAFATIFITFSYHGYKLMQRHKKLGIREIHKDPNNLDPEQPTYPSLETTTTNKVDS
jgi:hypothetical protein